MIHAPAYDCLGELLFDALLTFKSDVALIEASRKKEQRRLTYLQVRREAARVAAWLEQAGVGPGDRVAFIAGNQARYLIAAIGALWRGAVLVPLDVKLTPPELDALLEHAEPAALVTEAHLAKRLERLPGEVLVTERTAEGAASWEDLPAVEAVADPVPRDREDPATLVYSSGTGGTPKGCLLPHRAYLSQLHALLDLFPMERGQRYFSILPTNHAIDFTVGFLGPLCCGATVVHQRTLRPELLRWTMREYRITHMALVPMVLEAFERALRERLDDLPVWKRAVFEGLATVNARLTEKQPRPEVSRRLLKPIHDAFGGQLELLFCGGAFVDPDRTAFFYRLGIPVVVGYGLTEACTVVTVNRLEPFRPDSVGRPVDGVEVRVVDPGPDGVGEVQVRGPTVMLGYRDAPDLTEEAFDGDWLRTGDLGRLDAAGHLHLVGRSRNLIVTSGGKNIYPEDVEGTFADVPCEELVVFAADYLWPRRGLTGERLVAVVRGDDPDLLARLREHNRRLPGFKRLDGLVPWSEPFPRTASMKVKRRALAEVLRECLDRDAIRPLAPEVRA